jgi:hypothetical protein
VITPLACIFLINSLKKSIYTNNTPIQGAVQGNFTRRRLDQNPAKPPGGPALVKTGSGGGAVSSRADVRIDLALACGLCYLTVSKLRLVVAPAGVVQW